MSELSFEALPYEDDGILRFTVAASSGGFSGFAEVFQHPAVVKQFAAELMDFPKNIQDTACFEYGNGSDDYPYHVMLRAQVMDRAGHSAVYVRIQSFCGPIDAALCEFLIPAEPAAINDLGRYISHWSSDPHEPILWQPRV